MKSTTVVLNSLLLEIFSQRTFDDFTARELKDSYFDRSSEKLSERKTHDFIYNQLRRLNKKGFLTREKDIVTKRWRYKKTRSFNSLLPIKSEDKRVSAATTIVDEELSGKERELQLLQSLFSEYETDFHSTISETNEYARLAKSLPHMKPRLQQEFLRSRENCTRLLGKMKAVENLLFGRKV